jgi:clumping factor A
MFSLNSLVETSKEEVCKRELDENDVDSSCDSSSRSGSDDLSEFVQQDEAFVDNTDYDTNDGFVVADDDDHNNMMMLETDDNEADEEQETDKGQDESTDNKQRSCIFTGDYREAALALFGEDEADASDSDDSDFDCDTEASSEEDSECDIESWSGDDDDSDDNE